MTSSDFKPRREAGWYRRGYSVFRFARAAAAQGMLSPLTRRQCGRERCVPLGLPLAGPATLTVPGAAVIPELAGTTEVLVTVPPDRRGT